MLERKASFAAGGVAALAVLLSALAVSIEAGQSPAAQRPALFTEAQATRGEAAYRQSCASCHGAALSGGSAPALVGPRMAASWGDPRVTLDDLFFVMSTSMPPRASNTVAAQDHLAIFAYVLKMNGYPSGQTPLSANAPQLKQAHFELPG